MPDQISLFDKIFEAMPLTKEALEKNNARLDKVSVDSTADVEQAMNELEEYDQGFYIEQFAKLDKDLVPLAIENITLRGELLIILILFEVLHKVRELTGVVGHPYTLTPNAIINAVAVKEI
jgi:hypothetical protein